MAPEVKELHDTLIDLKRECQVLQDGTHIRLVDVLTLHNRVATTHQEMMAALILSPGVAAEKGDVMVNGGDAVVNGGSSGIAPATPPPAVLPIDHARSEPPMAPMPSIQPNEVLGQGEGGGAPPRRVPRGHTVCVDFLHDCYGV